MAHVPPDDPNDWSDEEWLDWLKETDEGAGGAASGPVTGAGHLARSATGSVLGAALRGLHRAIYGAQDDEVAIVADASGDPPRPDGVDVRLDPDHPEGSTVVVRRHESDAGHGQPGDADRA